MELVLPSIPAKTTIPAPRTNTIHRARLLTLLGSGLDKRASLIVAPAGFGKTTLLADFASTLDRPVAWLNLDRWDRSPRELMVSLAESLFPNAPVDIDASASFEDLRRQLRLMLWSATFRMAQRRVIVLDDYQSIEGSSAAVGLIEELIESASDACHIIIASRELPALGGLARLVAQGLVLCLGTEDLAFDAEEIQRHFAEARGATISIASATRVLDRTSGWPANVALLTASADGEIEANPKAELFLDELVNEAFQRQPAPVRKFLLSTSILGVLEPRICDQVLGGSSSRKILKELERRNLFVTRVEADPPSYVLLRPFRRFLKDKLRADKPAVFTSLSLTAGRLCEIKGDWNEAVSLYLEAQQWPDLIRTLRKAAESLLSYGGAEALSGWLDAIPREELAANLDLVLYGARAKLDMGKLDDALQIIADLLEKDCPETIRNMAVLYRGVCLSRKGQHPEAIRTARSAVSLLVKAKSQPGIRAEAYLRLGVATGASGKFADAIAPLRRALSLAETLGDVRRASVAADALGDAFANLGQINEAQGYFERARHGWTSLQNDYNLVLTLNNLAVIYSWQGEYDLSSQLLTEAIERSRTTGNARIEAFATLSLGDVKRDVGAYQEALDLYSDGLEKARRMGEAYFVDYAVDALGMTYLFMGDLQTAEVLIKQAAAEVAERGGAYQSGLLSLSLGILRHLRGEFSEAAGHLETAVRVLREAGAARDETRANFHLAHVYLATNSRRRAMTALQEVARLSREVGYHSFLAADARRCPALTAFAASKGIGDGMFSRLRENASRSRSRGGRPAEISLATNYPPIDACAFGESQAKLDGRTITDSEWSSLKSKEMFFFFLANQEQSSRDECCAALWPEFDQTRATSNFHSTLYRLRSATYFDMVTNSNGRYRLNPAAKFSFDVWKFESLAQDADGRRPGDPDRMEAYARAAEAYSGPFCREFYSEWAVALRQRLEDKYLRVLGILARHAFAEGAFDEAISSCDRILAIDDCNDEAQCLKIESFLSLGDRVSAVRHFETYKRLLAEEAASLPTERLARVGRRIATAAP